MRWNVFGGYLSKATTLLTALVTTRWIVHYLGEERFGLATVFWQIMLLAPVGDLGVGNGMTIVLARALGVKNLEAAKRITSTGFFLLIGIGIAMVAVCVAVLPWVPWSDIFHLKSETARAEALPTALMLFVSWSVVVPLNIGIILLNANRETLRYNIWFSLLCPIQIAATYWFIQAKAPLPGIVFTSSGLYGFVWIALAVHELGFRKRELWPKWTLFDKDTARELLGLGSKLLLSQTARTALLAVDAMILGSVFGAEAIAAFSLVSRLFFMTQVSQYAMNAWGPAFAASFEAGDERRAFAYFRKVLVTYVLVTLGLAAIMVTAVGPLMKLWVGDSVPQPDLDLRVAFGAWTVTWSLIDAIATYANAGRHVRYQTFAYTIATVCVVIAKFVLAKTVGPVGILWAFTGGMLGLYVLPMSLRLGIGRGGATVEATP